MAFTFDAVIEKITTLQPGIGGSGIEPCTRTDTELLQLQTGVAEAINRLQTIGALVAAEIAHRSRRELGHDGLAYKAGFRSPEKLIQHVTGTTGADARKLVRVGTQVAETLAGDTAEPFEPDGTDHLADLQTGEDGDTDDGTMPPTRSVGSWHAELDRALAAGLVSVDAADSIRRGLGEPGEGAPEAAMREAVTRLIQYATLAHADDVWARARNERDLLDPDGIADREKQRRDARYLKLFPQPDGMTRLSGLLDPESAQIVCSAFDAVTSPRRGGPRFTRDTDKDRAQKLLEDPRSTEQIMADTLVEIVAIATRKDTGPIFGTTRPTVRLIATVRTADTDSSDKSTGAAFGVLLGQTDPVSPETVERHLCGGHEQIVLDRHGHTLNYGRTRRLFSARQREILNARDGGCMWPRCDRPPDWCEAHHNDAWDADHGNTDVDDGILLCRPCHLRLHNEHWKIQRRPGRNGGPDHYWLQPPWRCDEGDDVLLERKNPLLDALHHAS